MVTVEPGGPQIGNVDTATAEAGPRNPNPWGLTTGRFEYDPPAARRLGLNALEQKQERPGEARCWLQVEPARKLANMMMLEKNSDDVVKFIVSWLQKHVTATS